MSCAGGIVTTVKEFHTMHTCKGLIVCLLLITHCRIAAASTHSKTHGAPISTGSKTESLDRSS